MIDPTPFEPPSAPDAKTMTTAHLSYHNGPMLTNAQVSVLYWTAGVNSQVQSTLPGFYTSVMSSAYFDWLTEYNAGGQAIGHGTFIGTFVDPSPPVNAPGVPISQDQIESELARLIGHGLPTAGPNSLYMIYFPPGLALTAGGWFSCTPTDGFCGFHSQITLPNGQTAYYGVLPDLGVCETRCGPSDQLGNTTSTSSHELVEAITDPALDAWSDSATGYEIADICQIGPSSGWQGTIGGYTVQKEWSNLHNACIITPPDNPPTAAFTFTCASRQCTFNGSTSSDLEGPISSYTWAFGDGSPAASGATTSHAFAANGTYAVRLTVTDAAGQTAQVTHNVTAIDLPPTAAFTATCVNRQCTFNGSASSDAAGPIAAYSWSFGDGSPGASGATTSHLYAINNTYTVTLTVTDSVGQTAQVTHSVTAVDLPPTAAFTFTCTGRQCTFNGSASSDAAGPIAAYSWSFGDGSPAASGATTSHLYAINNTYAVTLTVTDSVGQTAQVTHNVTAIDLPPTAAFTATCVSRQCTFNGSASSDAAGPIAAYSWSFGDGSPAASGVTTSHAFAANGTYAVRLTVTDSAGQTATLTQNVTAVDLPPIAAFTATCAIRQCTFNGSTSSDAAGPIAAYSWSFGDGSPAVSGATTSHLYAANNTYAVTLTVTDSAGQTAQVTHNVMAVDAPPHAAFWVVCIDRTCSADAEASSDDVFLANYAWSWGDGTVTSSGSASAPSHTYAGYGAFTIGLTLTDSAGQTASTSQVVTLVAGPTAAFTFSCAGRSCTFDASGSSGPAAITGYHWDWDDETTADATVPGTAHVFAYGATFHVHLTVTDAQGRVAGITKSVVVP